MPDIETARRPETPAFRTARVCRVADLTHDVREIELQLTDPPALAFEAGQFVTFEVERAGWPYPVTRAYSIASAPGRPDRLGLLLNCVPDGPGSTYLFGLREGDETRFRGPIGSFCLRPADSRDLLFVATGTGIAPIRSMLLSLADQQTSRRVTLFWGLRSERDLYYQDELEALRDRLPGLSYVTTLSRPTGAWRGVVGRVGALVDTRITSVANVSAYLCGSSAMLRDVSAILKGKGLCPIHREQYYRSEAA